MSQITKPLLLDETGKAIVAAIQSTDVAQARISEINEAAEAKRLSAVSSIESTGNAVLASIPDDYETLVDDVTKLEFDSASAIVETATGEIVSIDNSANRPFPGLSLYGKTIQDGTPTPNSPVDLVNVGNGGSVTVKACGKNLFNYEAWKSTYIFNGSAVYEDYGVTLTASENDCYTSPYSVNARIYVREGMTVTMSWEEPNNVTGQVMLFPNGKSAGLVQVNNSYTKQLSYTVPVDVHYVVPRFGVTTAGDVAYYKNIQIEVGTDVTTFEPYKSGGSVTVSTPNGLPGIPVSSGGNYTDSNGQMWICDEIDFGRGVYVQRVGQKTIDGTNVSAIYHEKGFYNTRNFTDAIKASNSAVSIKCNMRTWLGGTSWATGGVGIEAGTFWFEDKAHAYGTTNAEYNAWLADNPMIVIYPLATPIETALPADVIEAYQNLHSLCPNTTVFTDQNAGLSVDYISDSKIYVDDRISALLEILEEFNANRLVQSDGDYIIFDGGNAFGWD